MIATTLGLIGCAVSTTGPLDLERLLLRLGVPLFDEVVAVAMASILSYFEVISARDDFQERAFWKVERHFHRANAEGIARKKQGWAWRRKMGISITVVFSTIAVSTSVGRRWVWRRLQMWEEPGM